MNKPSYTAKKPLPRMLLLLRNSTQSRLSVEMSGSGTLSPQNLPGKRKRTVRLLADRTEGLSAGRERAVLLQMRFKVSSPRWATHPVAHTGLKAGMETVTGLYASFRRVSDANQSNTLSVAQAPPPLPVGLVEVLRGMRTSQQGQWWDGGLSE